MSARSNNLAITQVQPKQAEPDLTWLQNNANSRSRPAWEHLALLLKLCLMQRCDGFTIEPDQACWRLRFFAADAALEQIEHNVERFRLLTEAVCSELEIADKPGELRSLRASVAGARYWVQVQQLDSADGKLLKFFIEPWRPAPLSMNDMRLPPSIDKQLRSWIHEPAGWLTLAGPSAKLNTTGLIGLIQLMTAPEHRLLYASRHHPYSLPRVNQISLSGVKESHESVMLQQAMSMSFDAFALDGVSDRWLHSVTNLSDRMSTVVHTINADNTQQTIKRLQALQLSQNRYGQTQTAILMQYPVRLLCDACKAPARLSRTEQVWLNQWLAPDIQIERYITTPENEYMAAIGCEDCHGTGRAEWATLYEWLEFNTEITLALQAGNWQTASSLLQLQQSIVLGVFKLARRGSISIEEAQRVLKPLSHII